MQQIASEQGRTLGNLCSFLLSSASIDVKTLQMSAPVDGDSASEFVKVHQSVQNDAKTSGPVLADSCAEGELARAEARAKSIAAAHAVAKRNAAVVHLPEHDIKDAQGWTPWERHTVVPAHPEYRSLAV